jgi:hypothetical protein
MAQLPTRSLFFFFLLSQKSLFLLQSLFGLLYFIPILVWAQSLPLAPNYLTPNPASKRSENFSPFLFWSKTKTQTPFSNEEEFFYNDHLEPCSDNLHYFTQPDPNFGYYNGTTTLKALYRVQNNNDTAFAYIREHGVQITLPSALPGELLYLKGASFYLAPPTQIIRSPDIYTLKVYQLDTSAPPEQPARRYRLLAAQPFRLNQFPNNGSDELVTLKLDTPAAIAAQILVTVQTAAPEADDQLTFYFTHPATSCPASWTVKIHDSQSDSLLAFESYNDLFPRSPGGFLGNLASPFIMPLLSKRTFRVRAAYAPPIKCGETANLSASSSEAAATFTWLPQSGLDNPNIPNPKARPAQTTTYTVWARLPNGYAKDSVTVVVENDFRVEAGPDITIQCGQSAWVGSAPEQGFSYTWNPSLGLDTPNRSRALASPRTTTIYTLTAQNDIGCVSQDTLQVTVLPLPLRIFAQPQTSICGQKVFFRTFPSYSQAEYRWAPPQMFENPFAASGAAEPLTSSWVSVKINAEGCLAQDSLFFTALPLTVDAGAPLTVARGQTITLQARSNAPEATFLWKPGAYLSDSAIARPQCAPLQTIVYTITARLGRCYADTTLLIKVDTLTLQPAISTLLRKPTLHPNPCRQYLIIDGIIEEGNLEFFDFMGRKIWRQAIKPEDNKRPILLTHLNPGEYFVLLQLGKHCYTYKILKIE